MTKAAAPQKDDATARLKLGSIVRKTATVVAYLLASLVMAGVVASCASTPRLDCRPTPLPEACKDAL